MDEKKYWGTSLSALVSKSRFGYGFSDPRGIFASTPPKPYLRLRDLGTGKWAIVRVTGGQQYGGEIVATDLTRLQAEQMINLSKED